MDKKIQSPLPTYPKSEKTTKEKEQKNKEDPQSTQIKKKGIS